MAVRHELLKLLVVIDRQWRKALPRQLIRNRIYHWLKSMLYA